MKLNIFGNGVQPLPGTSGVIGDMVGGNLSRSDSLVYPQELIQQKARARTLYRPLMWRSVIGVEPVDTWARQIEDRKYQHLVEEPVNMNNKSPNSELPMPSFTTSNQFIKLFDFGLAYSVFDDDIEYARKVGVALSNEHLIACNLSFEMFLEKVASVGHQAMVGLGNLPDVSTATPTTGTSSTPWTGGNKTVAQLVEDLHRICNAVEVNSKQNAKCRRIAVPLAQAHALRQNRSDSLERSAWTIFREERDQEVELVVWDRLKTSGSGTTPCAIGWDPSYEYAPKMLMKREVTYGQPLRGLNGYVVPGMVSTGGVRCIDPTSVVKMSGL